MNRFSTKCEWVFLADFPLDLVKPQDIDSSSYSFQGGCTAETVGGLIVVKHNTLRLRKHSLNFSHCRFCIYQSATGDEKEREKLDYALCVYTCYTSIFVFFGVWWCWFFKSRLNVKNTLATFSSQFFVHINVDLYVHAFKYGFLCDFFYLLYETWVEYSTSFVEMSQKKARLEKLSNIISDWSEA